MKLLKFLAISAIMFTSITACDNSKDDLRTRLNDAVTNGKTYFGHHDDPVYGHNWTGDEGRSDVYETTGKYPGIISWDLGDLEWGNDKNLDGVDFNRMRQEVIAQDKRGGLNTFSWHGDHPLTGADSWQIEDTTLVSSIVNTEAGRAAYMKQLDYLCDFFNSLVDEKGNKIEVIFRPWHEHTGSWFWWGRNNCSIDDYKALWTLMREHFDARGVDNVLWAYSPDRCENVETYLERYPGDEYVDILGADVYHFNGEAGSEEYKRCAGNTLSIAVAEAEKRGKIAAFTETGLESLPISDWFESNLLPLLKSYPVAYVVVWRNAYQSPTHFYAPFPGHLSEKSFKEFSNDPGVIFVEP